MADVSKIKLPNGTTYNIKDNSGEKSSHIHDSTSFVPIESKTYTGVIAASNDDANCYKYCIKVVPDSYGGQWDIKYRLIATIDNVSNANGNGKQESLVYISGMRNTYAAYQTWNNITNTSYRPIYYHTFRPATEAGISYGHLIGPSLRYAYNPTTSTNKRNITIELLSYHGCTVTFFDSMLIYANVPGTGSTNYNNLVNFDATTQGNTMSGDRNDVNYYNRTNYSSRTTAAALYRYQLCLTKRDGTLVPVNSVNNSVATNKTLTTDTFDPFGEIFFWNSTSTYAANANVGNGSFYRQYLCDLRYSFNCGGYDAAGTLTARQPLYLVCALQSDGMAKLHSSPLSMTLPSSDDGLIYIYLGRTYEDTYPYRVVLTFNHPVYYYKNGRIRELVDTAVSAESASSVAWSGITSKPTTISGYGITDAKIASGTITLGSDTITPLTSASTLDATKLSGTIPSGCYTDTDTKVYQSYKTASEYTYWRPLLIGYSSGNAETFTPGDQTQLAYTFSTLKVQPSTGTIRVGNVSLYKGSYTVTLSPETLTANRVITIPNKAGTMALTSDITSAIADLPEPMIFKGSVGTSGTVTWDNLAAAAAANEGWTYKVITAHDAETGKPAAQVGDTIISNGTEWVVIPSGDEPSGTVTSVAAANATNGGLTISGSPITSSGTITIGHSNVLTSAQTTQAVYPIKIDKNGHISAYGSAVTIPTVPSATGSATTGITIAAHGTGTVIGVQSSTTTVRGVKTGTSSTTTASKVTLGTAISVPNVTGNDDVTVPIRADADTTVPTAASSATTVPIKATSATTVPIKNTSATSIPNVTAVGSGSASLTFTMDTTDTKKLKIAFSHTHTAPTLGTEISIIGVQSSTTSVTGVQSSTTSVTGVSGSTTVRGVKTGTNSTTTASKVTLGTAKSIPNVTAATDVTVPIRADADTTVPIKNTSASTFVTGTTHTVTDNGHTHTI